jgi:hypothetical protein
MENKTKWYKSNLGIIALLIVFFPAGVFLMWKYTSWHKYLKIGITGFFLLMLLAGASGDKKDTSTPLPSQQVEAKPTEQPKPTEPSSYELKAEVGFSDDAFKITNKDEKGWTGCKLELNAGFISGGYTYKYNLFLPNDPIIIAFREFTKGDGKRFNSYETKPQKLTISCDEVGETGKRGFGYFTIN